MSAGFKRSTWLSEGDSDDKIQEYARLFNAAWEDFGKTDPPTPTRVRTPPPPPTRRVTRAQTAARRRLADGNSQDAGGALDGATVKVKESDEASDNLQHQSSPEAEATTSDSGARVGGTEGDDMEVEVASPANVGEEDDDGGAPESDESGIMNVEVVDVKAEDVEDEDEDEDEDEEYEDEDEDEDEEYEDEDEDEDEDEEYEDEDEDEEFQQEVVGFPPQVEKIVEARPIQHGEGRLGPEVVGGIQYRVKWRDWDESYNSWERDNEVRDENAKLEYWNKEEARNQERNRMRASDIPKPAGPVSTLEMMNQMFD